MRRIVLRWALVVAIFTTAFLPTIGLGAWAQEGGDAYSTGMTLLGSEGCRIFIGDVVPNSPAEHAGIRPEDQLLAIEDNVVRDIGQAARLLRSDRPTPITVRLKRGGKENAAVSEREKRSAIFARDRKKILFGVIVPADTTKLEVDRMLTFDGRRIVARIFPTHYPAKAESFYAGFEIFILRDPTQVTIGGIEEGPASRRGAHWGDVLVSVNGIAVSGKEPAELERMFYAGEPLLLRLQIDRLGSAKTLEFHLEKAGDIARQNGKRFVGSQLIPIWASDEYVHCFLR